MNDKIINFVKQRYIYIFAYLYLFSSTFVFVIGNLKLMYSLPLSFLLFITLCHAIKNCPIMEISLFNNKKIWIILLLIICWIIYGGVGGFIWQNPWDHRFRNAIFKDLVNYSWPVINNKNALVYYYGFWLVPAFFGKIFGITVGYISQTIWAIVGTFIAFGLLCQWSKNVKLSNIIIFILYSGLDVITYFIFSKQSIIKSIILMYYGTHIELSTLIFNSSSNTTLVFWLYNQIIPFWIGMLLLLKQKNNKSLVYIFSLMLIYSSFPLIPLIPIVIYLFFKNISNYSKNKLINICRNIFTVNNITALLVIVIIMLFYKTNIAVNKISFLYINKSVLLKFLIYYCSEFIIYLIFIYKNNRKDVILNILIIISLFSPFIRLGSSYDFAYRTCIPLAFYIMLLIIKELNNKSCSKLKKICLIIILSIGAITPMCEFIRTLYKEKDVLEFHLEARNNSLESVFEKDKNECYENFIGDTNTFFYKYLSKNK